MAISTRLHGWIDYAAAISLGGFALVGDLKFDMAEGLLLFGAGLAMRRQPPAPRAILAFYGLAQFVLGLSTTETAKSGPGQGSGPIARLLGST